MANKIFVKLLRHLADVVENDECGLDEEEIDALTAWLTHRKVSMEQAAKYLRVSRPTLYRRIADGQIPKPRKEPGGKEYFFLDELEKARDGAGKEKN